MKTFDKILLIDDDSITNFINSTVIKNAGLGNIVKVATNGIEGLQYIKQDCAKRHNFPDLILIDINMPGMNGYEFIEEYRHLEMEETKKAKLMILTSSLNPKDRETADAFGVVMLSKPLRKKTILELFENSDGE
jgi:CheY-like chemotaxis protein